MKMIRARWRLLLSGFVLCSLLATAALALWAGAEIASPSRRPLLDYHREFLANPTAHGFSIDDFTASDGTPCLICTPDSSGQLGERGRKIRQQLTERGFNLLPSGSLSGTVVLVHGRRGRKEDYLPIAERLCAVGLRCIIPDLPAHGDHPATLATYGVREASLPARMLEEASRRGSFDPKPAGLVGLSMGGSVSIHAAALPEAPWSALVVIASFDSLPAVIEGQAAQYMGTTLATPWLAGADFVYHRKTGVHLADVQPHRHAASIGIPTLMAHGTEDRVSSIVRGQRLFAALPATTTMQWIEIPDAGHDDVLITAYPIYAEIAAWLLQHLAGK